MTKSIKKNYIYNLIFQILSIVLPIVTAPYLARILGVERVGIFSYTLSIVTYFVLFANLGIAAFGQREIALHQDNKEKYSKVFWNLISYRLIIGLLSLLAYIILIILTTRYQIIYAILTINLIANIFDISWLFQGLEEYKTISIRNIIVKLFFTASIFIFVNSPNDLWLYILLNSLSILISTAILWVKVPKTVTRLKLRELKPFTYSKDTIIYFLPQIATTVYTVLDKTMLGLMTDSQTENGYYEQAYKIISIALTIVTSLNVVMSPRIAFLYGKNKINEIKERLSKSLRFVSALTIPLTIGIAILASEIVPWFFGDGYEKVATLLPIFSSITIAIGLSNCIGAQCLTPCGMRAKSAIALWVGAGLNLVSNIILIPKYGCIGAAIGSLIAEFTIVAIYFTLARKYINLAKTLLNSITYVVAGFVMGLSLAVLKQFMPIGILYSFLEITIGAAIYVFTLFILHDSLLISEFKIIKKKVLKRF